MALTGVVGVVGVVRVVGVAVQCLLGGNHRAPPPVAIADGYRSPWGQDLGHDVTSEHDGIVGGVEVDCSDVRIRTFPGQRAPQPGNPRTGEPTCLAFDPARSIGTIPGSLGGRTVGPSVIDHAPAVGAPETGDRHQGAGPGNSGGVHLFEDVGRGLGPRKEQSHVDDAPRVAGDRKGLHDAGGNTMGPEQRHHQRGDSSTIVDHSQALTIDHEGVTLDPCGRGRGGAKDSSHGRIRDRIGHIGWRDWRCVHRTHRLRVGGG
jgi:hypothetical protein